MPSPSAVATTVLGGLASSRLDNALVRGDETAVAATAEYLPFHSVANILRPAYPDWPITEKHAPDWIIKIVAMMGGPVRQIINDIGNEKHYDTTKSEALLGRKYIAASDAVLASAESAVRLGIISKPAPKAK